MDYTETRTIAGTETAVTIEGLSLREAVREYCGIYGYDDQTDMLFHLAAKTLAEQYDQGSERYWMAMGLVAEHYANSVKRMRRNIANIPVTILK